MTARQLASTRNGYTCETMAEFALKAFAFTVGVDTSEDVGADFICTLFEEKEESSGGKSPKIFQYSRESFLVQVKTSNQKRVKFNHAGEGVVWLKNQTLPYFVLYVDINNGNFELYWISNCLLHIFEESQKTPQNNSFISLFKGCLKKDPPEGNPIHWISETNKGNTQLWLGKPLLKWNLSEAHKPEWKKTAYAVLSRAIDLHKSSHEYAKNDMSFRCKWKTNQEPAWCGTRMGRASLLVTNNVIEFENVFTQLMLDMDDLPEPIAIERYNALLTTYAWIAGPNRKEKYDYYLNQMLGLIQFRQKNGFTFRESILNKNKT